MSVTMIEGDMTQMRSLMGMCKECVISLHMLYSQILSLSMYVCSVFINFIHVQNIYLFYYLIGQIDGYYVDAPDDATLGEQ